MKSLITSLALTVGGVLILTSSISSLTKKWNYSEQIRQDVPQVNEVYEIRNELIDLREDLDAEEALEKVYRNPVFSAKYMELMGKHDYLMGQTKIADAVGNIEENSNYFALNGALTVAGLTSLGFGFFGVGSHIKGRRKSKE